MFRVKTYPSSLLVLMGSMDLLTTVIGILYFGAIECNPVLASVVSTNLPVFAVLKLTTTICVGLIFNQAKKILMRSNDKTSKSFKRTSILLKAAYIGIVAFLVVVVVNNSLVLANII